MLAKLPIRIRLAVAFSIGLLLVLSLAATFVYLRVEDELNRALDASLAARGDDVGTLAEGSGTGEIDLGGVRSGEGESTFTQVLSPGGRVVQSTLAATERVLNREQIERARAAEISVDGLRVLGIEGESRVLAFPLDTGRGKAIAVVGATTSDREEALEGILGAFALGAPFALLLASGVGYLLGGRSLAPVEAMRIRAQGITFQGAGERLPMPVANDELQRLAETLNAMLDRVEAALLRERVFVADASHELRTPLAVLKSEIELVRRTGGSKEELEAALDSAAEEVDQLVRLAEDLLVIARADQGRLPIRRENVDVRGLLERVQSRYAESATRSRTEVAVDAGAAANFDLDPLRIEQALGNLIDNALRHGGGRVRMHSERSNEGDLVLSVSDSGPGFPPAFEDVAFERFSQASGARRDSGAGLGLSIVRAIALAHGGTADIKKDEPGWTTIRMVVPSASECEPAPHSAGRRSRRDRVWASPPP